MVSMSTVPARKNSESHPEPGDTQQERLTEIIQESFIFIHSVFSERVFICILFIAV